MKTFELRGCMVALVTPISGGGDIAYNNLTKLIEWHIEQGTQGLVVAGTTGEAATLGTEEHCNVIDHVVRKVAGRIPVIAGTGSNSTREAIRLSMKAKELGADACLLITPYYNKPSQDGLFAHYHAVSLTCDLPLILYNVPSRTACDLLPETVQRLAKLPQIVAVKEAVADQERIRELRERCGEDFLIYSGDDPTAVDTMLQGGDGVISVTANVVPDQMVQLCRLALAGEAEQARALNDRLSPLHKALFVEANPIPVKWALKLLGRTPEFLRLPLVPLGASYRPVVQEAIEGLDLELAPSKT